MVRKIFFLVLPMILGLIFFSSEGVFGLFNSQSVSANNTFSTAAVFPTPTPTSVPSPSASPLPSVSPSPSPSVSPSPSPSPAPLFPNCPVEPGVDIDGKHWDVGYKEGIHWIVTQGLKFGSDYVYYMGPENSRREKVLQCYYPIPETDKGIQTNWMKKTEELSGWGTWANGADFGLDSGPYLFLNIDFSI